MKQPVQMTANNQKCEASIFILCGAKGVGKKSLMQRLKRHLPNHFVIYSHFVHCVNVENNCNMYCKLANLNKKSQSDLNLIF